MKKLVGRYFLPSYPSFDEYFIIHTDAITCSLGGLISQNWMTIAFYSCKLIRPQINYTDNKENFSYIGKP